MWSYCIAFKSRINLVGGLVAKNHPEHLPGKDLNFARMVVDMNSGVDSMPDVLPQFRKSLYTYIINLTLSTSGKMQC